MPDSDGSAKAEASPVASPAASPQPSTRGRPAPYPKIPAPNFEVPSPAAKLPARPRSHLDAPPAARDRTPAPTPAWGLPGGRRTQAGPSASPEAAGWGGGWGETGAPGAASSTCRGRRGAAPARKGQRLFRRRPHRARLAPPAAPVAPDTAPLVSASRAGAAQAGRLPGGGGLLVTLHAPTSSATSGATAPLSVPPGQLSRAGSSSPPSPHSHL